jgi:DNA invertase Pin-like site-specific DNA recombinase
MTKRAIIYARVSTREQNPEMQLIDLREYASARKFSVVKEYVDIASGKKDDRINYQNMLNDVRKRKTDVVLVWKFDRFARSTKELINALEEFNALGVDFISYKENICTDSPAGRVLFTMISAFSSFEADIIKERVKAGLEKAKLKGIRLGRPPVDDSIIKRVEELHQQGYDYRYISESVGISVPKYYQIIKFKVNNLTSSKNF